MASAALRRPGVYFYAGCLHALWPWPLALALRASQSTWANAAEIALALGGACALFILVGGLLLPSRRVLAGVLISLASVALLALLAPRLQHTPGWSLVALLGVTSVLGGVWAPRARLATWGAPRSLRTRGRGAALTALLCWFFASVAGWRAWVGPMETAAATASVATAVVLAAVWVAGPDALAFRVRRLALAGMALVAIALALLYHSSAWDMLGGSMWLLFAVVLVLPPARAGRQTEWWERLIGHPERMLGGTFLLLCAAGTLLLALPVNDATGRGVPVVDAAFTAVSAVCVTGLIVLDTPHDFSALGQLTILVLIQLGGLGIMAFATAALRLLGRRMSLRYESAAAGLLSPTERGTMVDAARRLVSFTFAAEGTGALILFLCFLGHGDGLGTALWRAVFTAISAFCNAGFALQTNNLIGYQSDPWVLHTVALLIILGGLSPAIALGARHVFRRATPVPMQHRLALATTAVLLVVGFLFILGAEWTGTLARMSVLDRIHNAWFQSVTLRTAGFNSVDIAAMQPATLMLSMAWMFIGGCPGGTAGGVKTTTVAVLLLAVGAAVRGRPSATAFGRAIAHRTVYRAAAIVTVAVGVAGTAVMAILLTQDLPARDAVFEVFSALGTVGLSTGATSHLDSVGKVIIIICMFVGRIGTLTMFMLLSQRTFESRWTLPEEELEVG